MNKRLMINLVIALIFILPVGGAQGSAPRATATAAIAQPVLKYANKGCYSSWCETGWYSSPAVADLDGDGQAEIIASAYSIVILDGATGSLKQRIYSGHDRRYTGSSSVGRTWPGIVVANLDMEAGLEIVTAHSDGWLAVYDSTGKFKPGWPKQVTRDYELRSLGVYNLDNNGTVEIITASTRAQNQWYVYEPNGSLRPSHWPQHSPDSDTNGYTHGAYNQNIAAGDIDGDGRGEIVGPNDTHYIAAFQDDGSQMRANAMYGKNPSGSLKFWSRVGVHVDQWADERGYAECDQKEYRPNFANSAPLVMDMNGDGVREVVVVGNVYNCKTNPYTDLYEIPYILNGDRTRWKVGAYDWTAIPSPEPNAAPRSENYDVIENSVPNPAAADLDGDGIKEILYPSYDGRMHAYWLDKTEHGSWPFAVTTVSTDIRFASEPVVADLDNNGQAEVIFTSWPQKVDGRIGKLHILSSAGAVLWEVSLPAAFNSTEYNGALAAPTLANVDADADLEVVLNTVNSGVVVYDLPGTASARLLWATGRGSYMRSGSFVPVLGEHQDFYLPNLRR